MPRLRVTCDLVLSVWVSSAAFQYCLERLLNSISKRHFNRSRESFLQGYNNRAMLFVALKDSKRLKLQGPHRKPHLVPAVLNKRVSMH